VPAPQAGDCCGANSFYNDPPDADTLNEVTTRFDARHRPVARTVWLVPRGNLDPNDVPIAGGGAGGDPNVDIGGVTQGLTTRWFYDEDLTDSVGLDAGVTVSFIRGGGSFTLDISALLTELTSDGTSADASVADFSAVAVVTPEDEIRVTIQDGAGRTVASGWLEQAGGAITWGTVQHDAVVTVSGFGDVLETRAYDALDHITRSRTDGAGRTLESEDAENEVSTFEYDGNSNLLASRDPNAVGLDCEFDERNRDVECTDTQGDVTARTYDKNNNLLTATDAKSNDTTCKYDPRDRRFECTDRISSQTDWRFDQNSNLLTLTDGESQVTTYEYDSRNLNTKTTWPDHTGGSSGSSTYGITECRYDAARRKELCTDQNGDTVTRGYDLANRLLARDYRLKANSPSGTIADTDEFEYDDANRMTKATSGRYNNVMDFAYDNAGRLTDEDLSVDFGTARTYAVQSDYDAANRRFEITYPDGTVVERDYTDRDQLEEVRYETATIDQRAYDAGMRLDEITSGNGIVTSFGYRDDNLTETITRTGLSGANFTYDYDANKNKLQETINSPMAAYGFNSTSDATYDDEDRLTEWNRDDSNQDQSWDLSLVGDWDEFAESGTSNFTETRTHGDTHELTAISGGPNAGSLTYDTKGNLTGNSNGQSYDWDFDNQLKEATVPNGAPGIEGTHEYTYDALGRRVSKFVDDTTPYTIVFVCTGQQEVAEYAANARASSPLRKYVYASYIDEPIILIDRTALGATGAGTDELFYYHCNHLYSVAALTDAAGAVFERYAYDAYGAIIYLNAAGTPLGTQASTVAQPYLFTGRRLDDETGLYHYRLRYYDSGLGRFVGRDRILYRDGLNLYLYVHSNPMGGLDPFGLDKKDVQRAIRNTWSMQYLQEAKREIDRNKANIINPMSEGCFIWQTGVAVWSLVDTVPVAIKEGSREARNQMAYAAETATDPVTKPVVYGLGMPLNVAGEMTAQGSNLVVIATLAGPLAKIPGVGTAMSNPAVQRGVTLTGTGLAGANAAIQYQNDNLTPSDLFFLGGSLYYTRQCFCQRSDGLTPPGEYFRKMTAAETRRALELKLGPARNVRPGADTFYNPATGRSFNVHTDPAHGPPHVDVRRRGPFQDRVYPLKPGGN
jgi:RHS repeat-associated protein